MNLINSRKTWCASSTHYNEEKFCGIAHIKLKKKFKNLLTIIIPRHINRINAIKTELNKTSNLVELNKRVKKIDAIENIYVQDFNKDYMNLRIK